MCIRDRLTIIPDNKNIYYLQNDPRFTYSVSGLVNNDNVSVIVGNLTTTDTSRIVGQYLINTGLTTQYNNYDISYQNAYLTITNAPISTTDDLFNTVVDQLSNSSNNSQIIIFQDTNTPILITASVYTNTSTPIELSLIHISEPTRPY